MARLNSEERERKRQRAEERRRVREAEERRAMNNEVTRKSETKNSAMKKPKQAAAPNSSAGILKERKRAEKARNSFRKKTLRRVHDGSAARWIGWRTSEGKTAEVVSYNVKDSQHGDNGEQR